VPDPNVLILTQPIDPTADLVIRRLYDRGVNVVRFDTGWFPREATLVSRYSNSLADIPITINLDSGRSIELDKVTSIWSRRPTGFTMHEEMDSDATSFARAETIQAMGGIFRIPGCQWVNHPDKDLVASYKPYQLALAARIGLKIPDTLITTDPSAAKLFIEAHARHGAIYKTLSTPSVRSEIYKPAVIFTSRISDANLEFLETVRYAPCLIQEYVQKSFEVRLTIINRTVFAVALNAPDEPESYPTGTYPGTTDWRAVQKGGVEHSVIQLPEKIESLCLELLDQLGLVFGAIDLIVTPEQEYVFVEVNPSGQWAWLEKETGLPMIDTLVDCLANPSPSK
jgi:glutathione synthase/RimK-type ligase-like ATP-grasp enzyme